MARQRQRTELGKHEKGNGECGDCRHHQCIVGRDHADENVCAEQECDYVLPEGDVQEADDSGDNHQLKGDLRERRAQRAGVEVEADRRPQH